MFSLPLILALLPIVLCSPFDQYRLPLTGAHAVVWGDERDVVAEKPLKIAIIGSGIVGASAAFTLAENTRENSRAPPISITIFEKNAIIGGRITSTKVFDQEELTIDTCAATFNNALDTCVLRLARETGLTASIVTALDNGTAIWNGEEIVAPIEDNGFRDLDLASKFKRARFESRYGSSALRSRRGVTQSLYATLGNSMFRSLEQLLERGNLNLTVVRGACEGGDATICIDEPEKEVYLKEVVEAGVRDRFFGDYDELNELNSVLGLADENALSSVAGGNLRLIDRLVKISNARLKLNSKVQDLSIGRTNKWNVSFDTVGGNRRHVEEFDKVIIAAPLSLTDLEDFPGASVLPRLQFADTVVTHFTTKWNLNATYFRTGVPVPQTILTSATATRDGNRAEVPFFSFRLLDEFVQPINSSRTSNSCQKLYKIVSSKNISLAEIEQYLAPEANGDTSRPAVTWMHREYLPRSVPRLDRAMKIQGQIEIGPGLFYAGGGAQVTDTVEFGCRMGSNAARLIVTTPPVRRRPGNG